jgi:hypothetical protein
VNNELTPKSGSIHKEYKSSLVSDIFYRTILSGFVQLTGKAAKYNTVKIVFK